MLQVKNITNKEKLTMYLTERKSNQICFFVCFRFLHSRLRTCTLRNDFEGQASLLNLLMRNYLVYNLYDQADKLVNKSTFPELASNNEWARFLYYLGMALLSKYMTFNMQQDNMHNGNS